MPANDKEPVRRSLLRQLRDDVALHRVIAVGEREIAAEHEIEGP